MRPVTAAAAASALHPRIEVVAAAPDYMQSGARRLRALVQQLASLPRHRDYKALQVISRIPAQEWITIRPNLA